MKKIILLSSLIVAFFCTFAQVPTNSYYYDAAFTPREHPVDFQHMKLVVDLTPEKGLVNGNVTHTFKVLQKDVDSVYLDAVKIDIINATVDGAVVKFKTDGKGVTIYFNKTLHWNSAHQLQIEYSAMPKKGIYFIGWNDPKNLSRKQVWTQGQGTDNRHWIPFYDEMNDKITSEIIIDFDSKYKVLSNGAKLSEKTNKKLGKTTWHYKMSHPHAPYLVMLGIGEYGIKTVTSKSGVNIDLWYYPGMEDRIDPTYKYTTNMMNFFEQEIGVKYPWEKYSQIPVQDFMYGAMENTTATLFGDFYFIGKKSFLDKRYIYVNAHEMAHQWFGDLITARSGSHHWLHESFATYYGMLFEREVFGQDYYNWERRKASVASVAASKADYKPIMHISAGSTRHYKKGSQVLHMLSYVTGREQYNASVKHYLDNHMYDNVDSEDLLIAFHEKLGLSLDWFWNEWVYKGGEPSYDVSFTEIQKEGKKYGEFNVEQIHETNDIVGLFKMPIVFEIHYTDGTMENKKVWIENINHVVSIPLQNKKVAYALFDPNSEILKSVSFNKNFEMLTEQALNAKHMLDRYNAIKAMKNVPLDRKRTVLLTAYNKENEFYAVKAVIISQLFDDENTGSKSIIHQAFTNTDVNIRRTAIYSTSYVSTELKPFVEKLLTDSSSAIVTSALEKLCFSFPDDVKRYLDITKDNMGNNSKNVRLKWLELSSVYLKDDTHMPELINYTSVSYEFITRTGAASIIQKLNYFDEMVLKNLCNGILSNNTRLSDPMKKVLNHFYNQPKYKKMIFNYVNSAENENREKLSRSLN